MLNDILLMSTEEAKNLQWLSAALVVLCLILLYCWHSKSNQDGYANKKTYGSFKRSDGMLSKSLVNAYLPGLHLSQKEHMQTVPSMHDLVTPIVNRFKNEAREKVMQGITNMKWGVDGMIGSNDPAASGGADWSAGIDPMDQQEVLTRWGGVVLPAEVITPDKTAVPTTAECQSLTGAILTMTDTSPNWGKVAGTGEVTV